MSIHPQLKARIIKLVGIYIDAIANPCDGAGWNGETMVSRMMEYRGFLPEPSGKPHDGAIVQATKLIKKLHYDYPKAQLCMSSLTNHQHDAIKAKHLFQGIFTKTNYTYTDADRAAILSISKHEYKLRLGRAYVKFAKKLEELDRFEYLQRKTKELNSQFLSVATTGN
ncbi:MAG: hypothetical protein E2O80_01990 [Betaproteobacteria bacterium]|nr:MAG: hypothetical protein E2O80_01990 [Betaproteobacteria bacterium]